MLSCIIIFRSTETNELGFVMDENGKLKVFANIYAALAATDALAFLQTAPYQIIELDEV